MEICVGDEILVREHGTVHQLCEVVEVGDLRCGRPYLVRWQDDGRDVSFRPGPYVTLAPGMHLTTEAI